MTVDRVNTLLLLLAVAVLVRIPSVSAVRFRRCIMDDTILALKRNAATGALESVDADETRRHLGYEPMSVYREDDSAGLRGGDSDWVIKAEGAIPAESVSDPSGSENETDGNDILLVRKCSCRITNVKEKAYAYCEHDAPICGYTNYPVYWTSEERDTNIYCYADSKSRDFASLTTLFLLVWFGLLIVFIVGTGYGRSCPSFVIGWACPWWNKYHTNRLLQHRPERARELIRRNMRFRRRVVERHLRRIAPDLVVLQQEEQQQQQANAAGSSRRTRTDGSRNATTNGNNAPVQEETTRNQETESEEREKRRPTYLRLRTRSFRSDEVLAGTCATSAVPASSSGLDFSEVTENDDLGRTSCVICFQALEEGDRVGALECNHHFHADCLKSWLKRRNVCPLCQSPNVAEPCCDELPEEARTEEPDEDDNEDEGSSTPTAAAPTQDESPTAEAADSQENNDGDGQ